jgi:hypothetical protein
VTSIVQDIQYAARSLRKSPLFATIAVTSVALGIGANAAVFTLLDQVVLRLMPVKDPSASCRSERPKLRVVRRRHG